MDSSETRLIEAAGDLDPADRALLSLLLDRGLDDAAIAELIASTPAKVGARRAALVRRLAEATGADPDQVRSEVERMGGRERDAPRSGPGAVVTLLGLGLLSALVFLLVVTLGSGESNRRSSPPVSALPSPPRGPTAKPLIFVPVAAAGRSGSGTGEIGTGGALRLRVRGLAPGRYEVWAFNSTRQARRLATFSGPAATVHGTMPPGRYRFLDVSREPDDGNRAHSGQSVLRAQL